MRNYWILSAFLGLALGCNTVDSSTTDTAGMYADLRAVASGNGSTEVAAWLKLDEGSLDFIGLTGGDTLRAYMIHPVTGAETQATMVEGSFAGATWYTADFDIQDANTSFRVELDRTATSKVSALNSTTSIPTPFTLSTIPANTTSFSRTSATTLDVTWDPFNFTSADQLSYEVDGSCIQKRQESINWQTATSVQIANHFLQSLSGQETNSCEITVTITLTRNGSVDPAFGKGGEFLGSQAREIKLTANP